MFTQRSCTHVLFTASCTKHTLTYIKIQNISKQDVSEKQYDPQLGDPGHRIKVIRWSKLMSFEESVT